MHHVMRHLETEVGRVRVMRQCIPQEVKQDVGGILTVQWLDSGANEVKKVRVMHAQTLVSSYYSLLIA